MFSIMGVKTVRHFYDRFKRIEYRLLVLLHILVVGEGQTLQHCQGSHEVAVDTAGLSADKLRHVGVLFLWHYA